MKGKSFSSERMFFRDSNTDVKITKLTAFPCVNHKVYFHINQFTPDSKTLIFHSQRSGGRGAGKDVFKVDTDGTNLTQLTDAEGVSSAILTYCGNFLLYTVGNKILKLNIHSFQEEVLYQVPQISTFGDCSSLPWDDSILFIEGILASGENAIVRADLEKNSVKIIHKQNEKITHTQVEPSGANTVAFQSGPDSQHRNIFLVDSNGGNHRPLELPYGNGHWMWVGDTRRIMSNLESEFWGISMFGEEDEEIEIIKTEGSNYWHASCDNSGQWMVSDTNWPDTGLEIINRFTKKSAVLCYTHSSHSHPNWSHPHPSFSPDLKYVVFNSDATGIGHVYLAEVPEDLLQDLAKE